MLKRTIKYTDYNGVDREEDFYFNFTEAELMELEMSKSGGLAENIRRIVAAQDAPAIIKVFKELVLSAYGEKSPDGKQFIKSEELRKKFSETPAYSILFMELATDENKAADFINAVVPNKGTNKSVDPSHPALK